MKGGKTNQRQFIGKYVDLLGLVWSLPGLSLGTRASSLTKDMQIGVLLIGG